MSVLNGAHRHRVKDEHTEHSTQLLLDDHLIKILNSNKLVANIIGNSIPARFGLSK